MRAYDVDCPPSPTVFLFCRGATYPRTQSSPHARERPDTPGLDDGPYLAETDRPLTMEHSCAPSHDCSQKKRRRICRKEATNRQPTACQDEQRDSPPPTDERSRSTHMIGVCDKITKPLRRVVASRFYFRFNPVPLQSKTTRKRRHAVAMYVAPCFFCPPPGSSQAKSYLVCTYSKDR